MTKKLILAFLVFFCIFASKSQEKAAAQCSGGNCYAPIQAFQSQQEYFPQSYSYPSYNYSNSYPIYYSYPNISSRIVYQDQEHIYASSQSVQNNELTSLVPVVKPKKSPLKSNQPAPVYAPILEGPSQIKVGELAVLRVKNATTKVAWIVVPQKINFQEFDNGQSACFSSPIAANISFFAAVGSGNDLTILPHNLVVIDDRPSPPSPPGPNPPNPNPPNPTDLKQSIRLAINKVQSQKKVAEAQFLAFSFLSIANLIKTGAITDSQQIIQLTTESNRQALGSEKEKWVPFFTDLSALLNNLSKSGNLATPQQHIDTWNIIADVLRETV